MTVHFLGCRMAASDFHLCRSLLETVAEPSSPFAHLLRRKLGAAMPVPDDDVDPLVATLNSRVEFRIDDEPAQTRIIVGSEFRNGLVGLTLPISTQRGLALLGLRQGQSCAFEENGRARQAVVCRIAWQPQAVRRRPPLRQPGQAAAQVIDFPMPRDAILRHSSPFPEQKGTRN